MLSAIEDVSQLPSRCNESAEFVKWWGSGWNETTRALSGRPDCVGRFSEAQTLSNCCLNVTSTPTACDQFCSEFTYLPFLYLGVSVLSAICCSLVFLTYFCLPRLRQTGYSSKVFLNRTVMDLVIAVSHILAGIHPLAGSNGNHERHACLAFGLVNEFALIASNLWYIFLAVDLVKAIRNPFHSQPSYTSFSFVIVMLCSSLFAAALGLLSINNVPGGAGTSMFYWCWITVVPDPHLNKTFRDFILTSFLLYYVWHVIFWVFSVVVTIVAGCILWGHLAASSETRKFVLKQNLKYVLILAIETVFIIAFVLAQVFVTETYLNDSNMRSIPFFYTTTDFSLAVLFAVCHSLRGTIDLFVWMWTFSIRPMDFSDWWHRMKSRYSSKREIEFSLPDRRTPLIATSNKDNLVNKALRRNAIYCINVGILDAVKLDLEAFRRKIRVGSVRESFSAAALMELDEENQRDSVRELYRNPSYRDSNQRVIKFPSASSHIKKFSFIDLEPRVFSMLRETYGMSPRAYRKSFDIKNAADIDGTKMLEKFTEGKSGSFFYFTQDLRFIIKTVTASEERFLRRIAYDYYEHMRDNKDSLIVRLWGLHQVRLAREQSYITVVVMDNIFHTQDKLRIHKKFDLKGSWVGRRALKPGQNCEGFKGTLKDLDLGEEKIFIGAEYKEQLMEQLRLDVQFLTKCHIMDYSLLLGIHEHTNASANSLSSSTNPSLKTKIFTFPSGEGPLEDSQEDQLTASDKKPSRRYGTNTSNCEDTRELHVPWFRQDGGGLRSSSKVFLGLDRSQRDSVLDEASNIRCSMVNVEKPPVTYFFGVVDILQEYTLRKKLEHIWKTRLLRQDRHGLSAVNETEYGDRFLKFLDRIIE